MDSFNYNSNSAAGVIRYSCGIMFSLFSFCYLYFIQGELLAEAQFVYSKGLTSYQALGSALVITLVLMIIQWVVNMITKLPKSVYAFSYFPSCMLLAMLSDIDKETIVHFSFGMWIWLAPLSILFFILTTIFMKKFIKKSEYSSATLYSEFIPNYIILLMLFLTAGSIPQTPDVYFYELKAERLILEGKYDEAEKVGETSLAASQRLTELRMYALSRNGELADKMFSYPVYYGTRSLLDLADTTALYRINNDSICKNIGAICGPTIKTPKRYFELMAYDSLHTCKIAVDYHLCYKLLDKDLDSFIKEIGNFYNISTDSLPKAYQEALLYYSMQKGDSLSFIPSEMYERYNAYKSMKAQNLDETAKRNRTRREYGDTFWWYYEFQTNM